MRFAKTLFLALSIICLLTTTMYAQTQFNDGPIQLRVRVREINTTFNETDVAFFGVVGTPDDLHYYLWARDNADLDGAGWVTPNTGCLDQQFSPPGLSQDWNNIFFDHTYSAAAVPRYFDIRMDAWEDEWDDELLGIGCQSARCQYNTNFCCGGILFGACLGARDDDDNRCNADPFITNMEYRQGPPCQWYNHGFVTGSCPSNNYYEPRIESYWRYTKGDGCGSEIPLGTLNPAGVISHFNSNECYNNSNTASPGNDVFYKFTVNQPMGLTISLCGSATWNTNLYLLDASCNQIAFNNNGCGLGNQSEIEIPVCQPGDYIVVVDGNGASDMGTFTLTIQDNPGVLVAPDAGADQVVCLGDSIPLGGAPTAVNGRPPYTYLWTGLTGVSNSAIANPNAAPTSNGLYVVTVTDSFGCSITDTMNVVVEIPPVAGLTSNTTSICSADTATLVASGGTTYQWLFRTPGSGFGVIGAGPNDTLRVNQPGDYAIVAIDGLTGCRDTSAAITLTVIPEPIATISYPQNDTFICAGESVLLVGSAQPSLLYEWLRNGSVVLGASQPFLSANQAGSYQFVASVAGACPDTSVALNVGINPAPVPGIVPVGNQQICLGDSLVMTASGGSTYQWYFNGNAIPGEVNPTYAAMNTGSYYADVVTDSGCVGSTLPVNLQVNLNPVASANASGSTNLCPGQFIQLNGFGGGTYQWLNNGTPIAGAISSNYFATATGNYSVVVTNASFCRDTSALIPVTVNPNPVASLLPNGPTTFCSGDSVTLNAGGGGTYAWRRDGIGIPGASNSSYTTAIDGFYQVVVTSAAGCTDTATATVVVNPRPVAVLNYNGTINVCEGDSVVFSASPSGMNYSWLFNTSPISGANDVFYTGTQQGDYQAIVSDPVTGCADTTQSFALTWYPPATANITPGPPLFICPGELITLTANNGTAYQWAYNGVNVPTGGTNSTYGATTTGLYSVTVYDNNNCPATASVALTRGEDPNASINLLGDIPVCEGDEIVLEGSGGDTYQWLVDDVVIPGATDSIYTANAEGIFTLVATNACGDDSADAAVPFFPGPGADFLWNPPVIYEGSTIEFLDQSVSAATWTWDFGDGTAGSNLQNPTHVYDEKGTYTVTMTITDDAGCTDQITKEIEVISLEDLLIPNVFTPNGDGEFDFFEIDWGGLDNVELNVFDRWGHELFYTDRTDEYWDGRFQQRYCQPGTYFYTAKGRTPDGFLITFHGNVTLIR